MAKYKIKYSVDFHVEDEGIEINGFLFSIMNVIGFYPSLIFDSDFKDSNIRSMADVYSKFIEILQDTIDKFCEEEVDTSSHFFKELEKCFEGNFKMEGDVLVEFLNKNRKALFKNAGIKIINMEWF